MRLALLLLIACSACTSQAQQPPWRDSGHPLADDQRYDVVSYALDLEVFPDDRRIAGTATVTAVPAPVDAFALDLAPNLTVTRVDVDGWPVAFEHAAEGQLRLALPPQASDTVAVRVAYAGQPHQAARAPWDGGFVWDETPGGQPWIATAVQGEGCDLWFPCLDHPTGEPDSVALWVTVPRPLVAASNGTLRGVDAVEGDRRRYRWHSANPINAYNVALNIAPYVRRDTTYRSLTGADVPVSLYVLPDRADRAGWLLGEMLAHLAFYERTLGPYPWRAEKYGVAHTPHLGMEHQTMTAYGSDFAPGPDGFDWLHHHELAHEWWGNLVTAPDWNDFWIHEGFGTYMQALYTEELRGSEAYRARIAGYRESIRNRVPVAPRASRTTDAMYFAAGASNPDIYYKGAAVLHTLRWAMGDSLFRTALRRFAYPTPERAAATDGAQARFATTDDFRRQVETLTGSDYGPFFEVYLRTAELPRLVAERDTHRLLLRWEAVDPAFALPVEVELDGVRAVVATRGGGEVALPSADATVVVDPDRWLLADVEGIEK